MLWAIGTQRGSYINRHYARGQDSVELCKAPDTTSTTTVTTTTTQTTTTSSTTTTTLEPQPSLPSLRPAGRSPLGHLDLRGARGNHGHELGLQAWYYDYSKQPSVPAGDINSLHCAQGNIKHVVAADGAGVVPALNFPGWADHTLGSKFKDSFCSRFTGWIDIPRDGVYVQGGNNKKRSAGRGGVFLQDFVSLAARAVPWGARAAKRARSPHVIVIEAHTRAKGIDMYYTYSLARAGPLGNYYVRRNERDRLGRQPARRS